MDTIKIAIVAAVVILLSVVVWRLIRSRGNTREVYEFSPTLDSVYNQSSRYHYVTANLSKPLSVSDEAKYSVSNVKLIGLSKTETIKPVHLVVKSGDKTLFNRPVTVEEQNAGSVVELSFRPALLDRPLEFSIRPETGDHTSIPSTRFNIEITYSKP